MRRLKRANPCVPQKRTEKGFALISAVAFLVLLLGFGASMLQQTIQELSRADRAKKETRAFNLAEAGIDYAAWRLYNGEGSTLPVTWGRTDLSNGSFTVTVDSYNGASDTFVLISTGTSQGWNSVVKVVGSFLSNPGEPENPVFDYALFSDADLTLSGTFDLTGKVHTNGKATCKGGPKVDGDLSAVGPITIKGSANITGSKTSGVPKVAMPTIDFAYYRSIANTVYTGDTTLSGNTTLNGVTYIDGNATIGGQFSGTGVIVVKGNVSMNGNATLVSSSTDEMAIVASGTVRINGNCRIEGWVYTHNVDVPSEFLGNGTADIVGGVAADVINCNGTLKIEYKQPTVNLPGGSGAPAQFDSISWRRLR